MTLCHPELDSSRWNDRTLKYKQRKRNMWSYWRGVLRDYRKLQPGYVTPNKKRFCDYRNSWVLMSACPSVVASREGPSVGRSAEWHSAHKEGMTSRENEPPVRCCRCCMLRWVEMWAGSQRCCCCPSPVVRPWRCFVRRLRNDAFPTSDTMSLVVCLVTSALWCLLGVCSCDT